MQDGQKAVWSIPYISVAFFPSLKHNFIAYHSSKVSSHPDCIFEILQLWESGFSRMHSNCGSSCSFEAEIIKINQSSHKMYSNNIVNFQESTTIWNAFTKKVSKPFECTTYKKELHIVEYRQLFICFDGIKKASTVSLCGAFWIAKKGFNSLSCDCPLLVLPDRQWPRGHFLELEFHH